MSMFRQGAFSQKKRNDFRAGNRASGGGIWNEKKQGAGI